MVLEIAGSATVDMHYNSGMNVAVIKHTFMSYAGFHWSYWPSIYSNVLASSYQPSQPTSIQALYTPAWYTCQCRIAKFNKLFY